MFVTLYETGEVHFRLLGTNDFHVKADNESFYAKGSGSRQKIKYENCTSSFGGLRHKIAPKSVTTVQHACISSFNQSYR